MISVFFNSFLIVLLFTPFGLFLSKKKQINLYYFSKQLIFGLIIISFIALFLNFFVPLNQRINTLILIVPTILILINFRTYFNKTFLLFLIISSLIVFILILESNVYRPDAGLYHLPYIKIINDEKIIFGLSNFHFRYAHISIIQYLSAISNNFIFKENGIIFASALIASSVIINFASKIYTYNKNKNYNFHFYFLVSSFVFIIYKMNRYSEYGNDAPAHFLFLFLISEILMIEKNKIKDVCNCLILISFIILNKITLILCFLFSFILLKKNDLINLIKLKRFYFLIFFTTIWFIKNIIVSGCVIYPVKSMCIDKLIWTDLKLVEDVSNENESWTKDWPTYTKIIAETNSDRIDAKEYVKGFFWVKYWAKGHMKKIIEILLPYLLFMIFFIFYLNSQKKNLSKFLINKKEKIIISILFLSCLLWFIKVPVFRYGYSYLISFISLVFASICFRFLNYKNNMNKFFNFFLVFCFTIFFTKNFLRVINTDNDYNNYPWPKFYAMDEKNLSFGVKEVLIKEKKFYKPNKYCMFSNSPCGQYGVKKNLDLIKKKNYYILYIK